MLQNLFPKLRFALVAVVLLWIKTYIVYKLAFDIRIDNFFEEFMLFINPLASLLLFLVSLYLHLSTETELLL